MTYFEQRALKACRHRMYPVRDVLTVYDTTLERVAAESRQLAGEIAHAEEVGRELQAQATQRARVEAARTKDEEERLTELAGSIHFPQHPS